MIFFFLLTTPPLDNFWNRHCLRFLLLLLYVSPSTRALALVYHGEQADDADPPEIRIVVVTTRLRYVRADIWMEFTIFSTSLESNSLPRFQSIVQMQLFVFHVTGFPGLRLKRLSGFTTTRPSPSWSLLRTRVENRKTIKKWFHRSRYGTHSSTEARFRGIGSSGRSSIHESTICLQILWKKQMLINTWVKITIFWVNNNLISHDHVRLVTGRALHVMDDFALRYSYNYLLMMITIDLFFHIDVGND